MQKNKSEFKGHTYRMFPVEPTKFSYKSLEIISDISIGFTSDYEGMPAGYTYLGQFIDHDMVRMNTPKNPTRHGEYDSNQIKLRRSAGLDLDSLYGSKKEFPNNKKLIEGKFKGKKLRNSKLIYDFYRFRNWKLKKKAKIEDDRNDENFIVAQIHILFMNAHNKIMERLPENESVDEKTIKSRKYLTNLYHRIIVNDYLENILNKKVYNNLFVKNESGQYHCASLLGTGKSESYALPLEFIGAAFRFGHSMVRRQYILNSDKSTSLAGIMKMTGEGGVVGKNLIENLIQWELFFQNPNSLNVKPQPAAAIDVFMVQELRNLPNHRKLKIRNLMFLNLLRGQDLGLPCAQDVLSYLYKNNTFYSSSMGLVPIQWAELKTSSNYTKKLYELEFINKTPLFLYILIESYLQGKEKGYPLGTLGSIIVGETFKSILTISNEENQLNEAELEEVGEILRVGIEELKNFKMFDLIKFVNG